MKLAIVGLGQSGKTTVFNALTGSKKTVGTFGKIDANIAVIKVPDERVDWLSNLYNPKKIVHAAIDFLDIPASINDASSLSLKTVATVREADALVFVIRGFVNASVVHELGSNDPLRDFGQIKTGLILQDMGVVGKRLEKLGKVISKGGGTQEEKLELPVLEKITKLLESDRPAQEANLSTQEEKVIRSFQLLTLKPYLILLNVSEGALQINETFSLLKELPNSMAICAKVEMEIQELEEKDKNVFLNELGIKELSLGAFIRKAYETLGLISFFTVGSDEVRAWTIHKDTPAAIAAGKIHTDMERGFIRAEVFSYNDLKLAGSEQELKTKGLLRLEGKDYIVKDGDILSIKFNV